MCWREGGLSRARLWSWLRLSNGPPACSGVKRTIITVRVSEGRAAPGWQLEARCNIDGKARERTGGATAVPLNSKR